MPSLNFTLYLDSAFPRNLWKNDLRCLTKLCEDYSVGHYSIDIVHLKNERQRAFRDGVIKTPTVLIEQEPGRKKILGDIADTEQFLRLLNLAKIPELSGDSLREILLSDPKRKAERPG